MIWYDRSNTIYFYNSTYWAIVPKLKLISAYKHYNYAPWYDIKLHYKLNDKLSFTPFIKAYIFGHRAEADWILHNDFAHGPSFEHKAFGAVLSLNTKVLYKATNNLDIFTNLVIKRFTLIKGADTTFLSNRDSNSRKAKRY